MTNAVIRPVVIGVATESGLLDEEFGSLERTRFEIWRDRSLDFPTTPLLLSSMSEPCAAGAPSVPSRTWAGESSTVAAAAATTSEMAASAKPRARCRNRMCQPPYSAAKVRNSPTSPSRLMTWSRIVSEMSATGVTMILASPKLRAQATSQHTNPTSHFAMVKNRLVRKPQIFRSKSFQSPVLTLTL